MLNTSPHSSSVSAQTASELSQKLLGNKSYMTKIVVDIDHLADLARLDLNEEEKAMIAPQLLNILTYVGKLTEVDTSGVSPNVSITDLRNVWREDVAVACDAETHKRCLDAFPKSVGSALVVPGIFEERTE